MSEAGATELESIETNLKNKLNSSVKNHLIKNEDFQKCLSVDEKTAIVYRIAINKKHYYIRFSTPFLTEVSAFTRSNPAEVYTSLKDRVKVNEREYNFVMFLFLLKLRETETTEIVEPQVRGHASLFDRQDRQTAFDSFKLSYPDEKVNIRDDVILEVPQVVVCGKLLTFKDYQKQEKDSSCAMMGGKTKRKSKKRMIKRKSKKRMIKRKSKKRMIK